MDRNRVPGSSRIDAVWPYFVLGLKLVPFYIWFTVFSLQAHKEERFMYVAYPLLALNAGISIYLIRSWSSKVARYFGASVEVRALVLRYTSLVILVLTSLLSISRIVALLTRYRAPFVVYSSIWREQLPDQLMNRNYLQEDFPDNVNLSLKNVCVGKEWYRFPSQFFLPSDTRLQFLKSEFDGQLPQSFEEDITMDSYEDVNGNQVLYRRRVYGWYGARKAPAGLNSLNLEDPSVYVQEEACDYLVDADFPLHPASDLEPRYLLSDKWEVLTCVPYLDNENSNRLARAFWIPGSPGLQWGDYCMLKRKT